MILNLLKNLRHRKLKQFQKFWVFWGNIYRKVVLKLDFEKSCKKKISRFGPFNMHPIFLFSDYENWGGGHNTLYNNLIELSSTKKCIIDIGAHIGLNVLPISNISLGRTSIHCFEPSDINIKFLKYHIKRNSLKNIFLNKQLVGAKEKKNVIFYEKKDNSGLNSVVKLENKGTFHQVRKNQICIDIYCKKKKYLLT